MEIGAIRGGDDLEAIWNALNGGRVVVGLRQTSRTPLAAFRAPQFFVPLIRRHHGRETKRATLICRLGSGQKLRRTNSNRATVNFSAGQPFARSAGP
jgi:hypothetical protein